MQLIKRSPYLEKSDIYVRTFNKLLNSTMSCYFLLQGIFLTQGSGYLEFQVDSLPLSHLGSPKKKGVFI